LKYLNINSLLNGGLFCKIETQGFLRYKKNERREGGSSQPRREKCPLPLRNPKLCILPSF
jgi:hypothetical protein